MMSPFQPKHVCLCNDSPSTYIGKTMGPVDDGAVQYNLALLAHLIYLARRSESAQQLGYLDWASKIVDDMQHQFTLCE